MERYISLSVKQQRVIKRRCFDCVALKAGRAHPSDKDEID